MGIVGPNGAGKSTLLKVIARVSRPTEGRLRLRGRVAPLLELGAGFDYEMTGRENVFLNGTVLGFSRKDMARRLDRIVDFSGIGEFIDAPVRTYSSGMVARLGFAVATDVRPEILIIDEVLAVGDADFQKKSAARIREFREGGSTILVVSHSPVSIKSLCNRVLWLCLLYTSHLPGPPAADRHPALQLHRRRPGRTPVSYTHLDVYKRQI